MILVISTACVVRAYGFIKSRKSDSKIMDMREQMYQFADQNQLELMDILIDDKADCDVDRHIINALMDGVECGRYSIILVRNINDITDDLVEQRHFVRKVQSYGGQVVSIYDGQIAWNDEEC